MKLPSLFKTKEEELHRRNNVLPWQNLFPSCSNYPKTLSFRGGDGDDFFKTVNSVFLDPTAIEAITTQDTPSAESWITTTTTSSESASTESEEYYRYCNEDGESLEMVVRGVKRSERLLFEAGDTSSILEKAKGSSSSNSSLPFKESVVVAMESEDPYSDFRRSMEEMVECHGVKDDWEGLEELLCWYLKVNGKNNHGFIVSAFVDLLVTIAVQASTKNNSTTSSSTSSSSSKSSDSTTITTYSSALSSFSSSSPLCLSQGHNENVHHNQHSNDSATS
ncbi:hypothetical protein PIB30_081463 [Stylosanthes scabra]|uniref:Transcription repressor n=1 Tax=Stylosanthes scabra TaxID=79078 RepID=A0ABU6QRA2_9FABA|nr:hypothetical protein [Stylosanthes scabra]